MGVRSDLVDFLKAAHPEFSWFDYPPDNMTAPAVLVNPASPYVIPNTQAQGIVTGIDLVMLVKRTMPAYGLDELDQMNADIWATMLTFPNGRVLEFGDVGTVTESGVEYLSGTLQVAVISELTP